MCKLMLIIHQHQQQQQQHYSIGLNTLANYMFPFVSVSSSYSLAPYQSTMSSTYSLCSRRTFLHVYNAKNNDLIFRLPFILQDARTDTISSLSVPGVQFL